MSALVAIATTATPLYKFKFTERLSFQSFFDVFIGFTRDQQEHDLLAYNNLCSICSSETNTGKIYNLFQFQLSGL